MVREGGRREDGKKTSTQHVTFIINDLLGSPLEWEHTSNHSCRLYSLLFPLKPQAVFIYSKKQLVWLHCWLITLINDYCIVYNIAWCSN